MNNPEEHKLTIRISALLKPISTYLASPKTIEIWINPTSDVIVKTTEGIVDAGNISPYSVKELVQLVATHRSIVYNEENPYYSVTLPTGQRFSAIHQNNAISPDLESDNAVCPALSIRLPMKGLVPLAAYVDAGVMRQEAFEIIKQSIVDADNIFISGSTGSGKTTFMNAMLHLLYELLPEQRIIVAQDTREVKLLHNNAFCIITNKHLSLEDSVSAVLRHSPGRLMVGEVLDKGGVAYDTLQLWDTGHPGGFVTLHANSALDAAFRFLRMCGRVYKGDPALIGTQIAGAVGLVIHLQEDTSHPSGRVVQSIAKITDYDTDRKSFVQEEIYSPTN